MAVKIPFTPFSLSALIAGRLNCFFEENCKTRGIETKKSKKPTQKKRDNTG
jgi:hypothetical protein